MKILGSNMKDSIFFKVISGSIEIARGMLTILKHAFRPSVTLEYPEVKPKLSTRYKGRLALLTNPDGSFKCIGCGACARVCPCMDLIQVKTEKDENKKLKMTNYVVDIGRCIFCGNCTQACNYSALVMTDKYELADYSREKLVFDKDDLKLSPSDSEEILGKMAKDN